MDTGDGKKYHATKNESINPVCGPTTHTFAFIFSSLTILILWKPREKSMTLARTDMIPAALVRRGEKGTVGSRLAPREMKKPDAPARRRTKMKMINRRKTIPERRRK